MIQPFISTRTATPPLTFVVTVLLDSGVRAGEYSTFIAAPSETVLPSFGVRTEFHAKASDAAVEHQRLCSILGTEIAVADILAELAPPASDYVCPNCRGSFSLPLGKTCNDHRPQPVTVRQG
jgi:hypothetical protein